LGPHASGVSGAEGPASRAAPISQNHLRFALIENEERTRQAFRGIKAMLAKGVVPAQRSTSSRRERKKIAQDKPGANLRGRSPGIRAVQFEKQSTRRSRALTRPQPKPCHPERSEGSAVRDTLMDNNHLRFALIENEARTRQALCGIKAMLAKGAIMA